MPSTANTISKVSLRYETTITLKDIFTKHIFVGMYDEYYCFKILDQDDYDNSKKTNWNFFLAKLNKKTQSFLVVAQVDLSRKSASSNRWKVEYVYVHSKHRGKGLAINLYHYLITTHGMTIMSGDTQSPGGKYVWRELSKLKDIDIAISNTNEERRRKTPVKFVNGRYPENVKIEDVVFIATKGRQRLVRYA